MDEIEETPSKSSDRTARGPISIAFLFYLITLAAILSACMSTLVIGEAVTAQLLTRMIFVGIFCGLLIGGLTGIFYYRGWKAIAFGTLLGSVIGAFAGALALIKNDNYMEIVWVAFLGSWFIIIAMLLTARFQKQVQL